MQLAARLFNDHTLEVFHTQPDPEALLFPAGLLLAGSLGAAAPAELSLCHPALLPQPGRRCCICQASCRPGTAAGGPLSPYVLGLAVILAVLILQIPWLPYLGVPVMSIVGLLAGYGPALLLGESCWRRSGRPTCGRLSIRLGELLFILLTGFAVNLLTLGTLTTAVSWYRASQDRSDELLWMTASTVQNWRRR